MATPLTAGLPPNLDLDGGYTLRVTALDATTGAVVSTVKVANVVIMAANLAASAPGTLESEQWVLVPGPE